jgi:hypothetical protein
MGPISIVCSEEAIKHCLALTKTSKDTEEQKREFLEHPEKLLAYRKAIEADLNGGFESVCYE